MPTMKRRTGSRATRRATPYSSRVTMMYSVHSSSTYQPSAPSTAKPTRAQTASTSANTPSGATHSTQRTTWIMVSAMACTSSSRRARRSGSMRVVAKPKNSANTTSGSMALAAAAASALLGMTVVIHSAKEGARPMAAPSAPMARRNASTSAWSRGTSDSRPGAITAVKLPEASSRMANTAMARRAVRPEAAASAAEVTPSTTSAATSGTTVICRALSQSRPTGWARSAARAPSAGSVQARTRPALAPRMRAMRTRAALDRRGKGRSPGARRSLDGSRILHQHAQVGLVFAKEQEHQVEQVLQGGLVEQQLHVRPRVVGADQEGDVGVGAQRVGGVAGDGDHAPAALPEQPRRVAQGHLLAVLAQ